MAASSSYNPNLEYKICDIPLTDKKRMADLLDKDEKWVGLAQRQMGYDAEDVESIRRRTSRSGQSPGEQLLVTWDNHTVTELFAILSREKIFSAMEVLKRFVAPKYHFLLQNTDHPDDSLKVLNGPIANPSLPESSEEEHVEVVDQNRDPLPQPVVEASITFPFRLSLPTFKFEELRQATNNFNPFYELGRGSVGVVYKGMIRNTDVVVKKIAGITTESERIELRQTFNELTYLDTCRHANVLQLMGCSMDLGGEPCIVYPLMPQGSLDSKLFPKRRAKFYPLSMADRARIAIGTARGLQYLHIFADKPIIHGHIKPSNILLDNANEPKISDLGLIRKLPVQDSVMEVSRVYDSRFYMPPEFSTQRKLSVKVDSYSFGLVLYAIVTGQRIYNEKRKPPHLNDMVMEAVTKQLSIQELMDPSLPRNQATGNACFQLLKAGKFCTEDSPERRIDMVTAYELLAHSFYEPQAMC